MTSSRPFGVSLSALLMALSGGLAAQNPSAGPIASPAAAPAAEAPAARQLRPIALRSQTLPRDPSIGRLQGYEPGKGAWLSYRGDLSNRGRSQSKRPDYQQLERRWKHFAGGPITSTPAFAQGRLIVATEVGSVLSVEAVEGKRQWTTDVSLARKGNGVVISSPMILEGRIFVGTKQGHLVALDFVTGEILWRRELTPAREGRPPAAIYASPKGDTRGVLVATEAGELFCVDPATGETRWKAPLYEGTGSAASVLGDTVWVSTPDGILRSLDYATGEEKSRIRVGGKTHSAPALGYGYAFLMTDSQRVAIDLMSGKLAWAKAGKCDSKLSAAVGPGGFALFAGGGHVHGARSRGGGMVWDKRAAHKTSPPIVNGDDVLFTDRAGWLRVHDVRTGDQVFAKQLDEQFFASPIVVDGTIYLVGDVRNGKYVHALR